MFVSVFNVYIYNIIIQYVLSGHSSKPRNSISKPNYGCQVTIQVYIRHYLVERIKQHA